MKTFLSILYSFLTLGVCAQDVDSMTSIIRDKLVRQLDEQGVFDYQNKRVPSFKLRRVDGKEFDSESLLGKPTVLNFWFTACAPCIEEIPMLNSIQESYSREVNFIAITYETSNEIARFLERKPFNFIQLVDGNHFFKEIDIKTSPRTLIADENLIVRYIDRLKPKDLTKFETELRNQIDEMIKR